MPGQILIAFVAKLKLSGVLPLKGDIHVYYHPSPIVVASLLWFLVTRATAWSHGGFKAQLLGRAGDPAIAAERRAAIDALSQRLRKATIWD